MTDLIELRMNVAALKRVDPYVKDILETATHVALYTFNPDLHEWAKTDIEGALFVYSRNGEPYNGILIMNRLNTNNLVEPVTHGLELQLHEPFLLYRNSRCDIYGIWFYEKEECIRIATFMSKLLQESEEKNVDRSPLKVKKNYALHGNNVDIFSMLSKAQENFNVNKEIKKKGIKESLSPLHNTMIENITSGPLMAPLGPDVTSQSVMDFFAKAKVNTRQYKPDQPTPGNVSINETKPLLARLMSHSSAHTLEHIEKQQRSITPQPSTQSVTGNSIIGNNVMSATANRSKRRSKVISQQDSILPCTAPLPKDIQPSLIHSVNDTNGTVGFLRIQSPTAPTAPSEFTNNQSTSNANNSLASLFAKASSTSEDIGGGGSTLSGTKSAPALIPPTMFAAPSPPEPLNRPLEPLTRNQLLQAFNYLLNSDPEFINKLHEAYVKSFGEILS